jgi:hypothetical protein
MVTFGLSSSVASAVAGSWKGAPARMPFSWSAVEGGCGTSAGEAAIASAPTAAESRTAAAVIAWLTSLVRRICCRWVSAAAPVS